MIADAAATGNATVKSKVEAAIETNAPTLFEGGVDKTALVNSVTTAITDTISKSANDLTKEISNTQDINIGDVSAENITQSIRLVFISTVLMESVSTSVATLYAEKEMKVEMTDGPPASTGTDEWIIYAAYAGAVILVVVLASLICRHRSDVTNVRYKFGILSVIFFLCASVSLAAYFTQAKPAQTEYMGTYIGLVVGLCFFGIGISASCFRPPIWGWWLVVLSYTLAWSAIGIFCGLLVTFDLCIA